MPWNTHLIGYAGVVGALTALNERWTPTTRWVVGTDIEYAIYLEAGTRFMPPYPFLFPAVDHVVNTKGPDLAADARSANHLIALVAREIEAQAKANATAPSGGSRSRSPGTHPDHPQVQTGDLRASIRAEQLS